MSRLEIYDVLRTMHRLLKDVEEREDDWEQTVLDTVAGVLYMAEGEFVREPTGHCQHQYQVSTLERNKGQFICAWCGEPKIP